MRFTQLLILFLLAFVFSLNTNAEDKMPTKTAQHSLGLNAGWVVGNGIIYRMYRDDNIYQATFVGMIDKENDEEYLNFSMSYARYLNRFDYGTQLGLKWLVGGEAIYDVVNDISDNGINLGTGIGLDVGSINKEGIVLSMDLIYTIEFKGISNPEFTALSLKPSLGLLYNF